MPVLWSVASGWAGSFVTTTETPLESATKSRSIAIRLWLAGPAEPKCVVDGGRPDSKWRRVTVDNDGD